MEMSMCLEQGLVVLESAGCCLFQLTMRKFDVKKNSFLRKDLLWSLLQIKSPADRWRLIGRKTRHVLAETIYHSVIIVYIK